MEDNSSAIPLPAIILEGSVFFPHNTIKLELSETMTNSLLETWSNSDNALMSKLTGKWLVFFTAMPHEANTGTLHTSTLALANNKTVKICTTGCVGEIISVISRGLSAERKLLVLVKGLSRCTFVNQTTDRPPANSEGASISSHESEPKSSLMLPYVSIRPFEIALDASPELEKLTQKVKTHAIALFILFPVLRSVDAVKALQSMSRRDSVSMLADILVQSVEDQQVATLSDRLAVLSSRTLHEQLTHTLKLMDKAFPMVLSMVQVAGEKGRNQGALRGKMLGRGLESSAGERDDNTEDDDDLQEIQTKLSRRQGYLPDYVQETIQKELKKLRRIPASSPDYHVTLSYLHTLVDFPWGPRAAGATGVKKPVTESGAAIVQRARRILDEEHFGLLEVKERILQFLAVKILRTRVGHEKDGGVDRGKGMILCLVGPPGVGKTSLAKSIAQCLGLGYCKLSLGGVHDPAELRGHRRTYIGSMMGAVAQGVARGGGTDVVMVLDEIDKVGWRGGRGGAGGGSGGGDVQGVLLEVLDPDHNRSFTDHYLAVPLDLSPTLFIATANSLDTLSPALLDRMDIVKVGSYGVREKVEIGLRFLVPRQIEACGLGKRESVEFTKEAVREIVVAYTREAGVRQLDREIASICRHAAMQQVQNMSTPSASSSSPNSTSIVITPQAVHSILGAARYATDTLPPTPHAVIPGVVMGLAYTPQGGELLYIEAVCISAPPTSGASLDKGKHVSNSSRPLGQVSVTGNVGKVMEESCQLCLDWLRANASKIPSLMGEMKMSVVEFHERLFFSHLRLHLPGGAVAKDGPSAGAALLLALLSCLSRTPVSPTLCLTGEVTLRGAVLAVGGIKEKVMAAVRGNLRKAILPGGNRRDFEKIQKDIQDEAPSTLTAIFVDSIEQLIQAVFGSHSSPQKHSPASTASSETPAHGDTLSQSQAAMEGTAGIARLLRSHL